MENTEKIGVKEWLPVKQHSRSILLKLRPEDARLYDIQLDDLLLVTIHAVKRVAVRETEESP